VNARDVDVINIAGHNHPGIPLDAEQINDPVRIRLLYNVRSLIADAL